LPLASFAWWYFEAPPAPMRSRSPSSPSCIPAHSSHRGTA
jgi:hypothetical protein